MQDRGLGLTELLVGHGTVGRAEVDRALEDLADAAAAADRLIVDLYAGLLVVRVEPLRVDRIGERGACAVDQAPGRDVRGLKRERRSEERSAGSFQHQSLLGVVRDPISRLLRSGYYEVKPTGARPRASALVRYVDVTEHRNLRERDAAHGLTLDFHATFRQESGNRARQGDQSCDDAALRTWCSRGSSHRARRCARPW